MSAQRLTVRGFKNGQLLWEEHLVFALLELDRLLPTLAEEHAKAIEAGTLGMIEIEFLDEPDVNQRFFRIGVETKGMVLPELHRVTQESDDDYAYQRDLPDGRSIWVNPRLFNAILIIGPTGGLAYDSHWCYDTVEEAIAAAVAWDPATQKEPEGWFRHAMSGRRRPGGDKSKEYIDP